MRAVARQAELDAAAAVPDAGASRLLLAAARLVYRQAHGNNQAKLALAQQLIVASSNSGSRVIAAHELAAARRSSVPLPELLAGEPWWRLHPRGLGGGAPGLAVELLPDELVNAARRQTKAGVLVEELPPPVGFTASGHPIRPGRPACPAFLRGQCDFKQLCVFTHPGPSAGAAAGGPAAAAWGAAQHDTVPAGDQAGGDGRGRSASAWATWADSTSSTTSDAETQASAQSGGGASSASALRPAARGPAGRRPVRPMTGKTADGLPLRLGAPNCPFYMSNGTCKFRSGCIYHHPPAPSHPACVLRGELPHKPGANEPVTYARLVNMLERVWDYESCQEAQLKLWLARHLLSRSNPARAMWTRSAALPAAQPQLAPKPEQPLGPYSCTLAEAGTLLHALWAAQPDAAALAPMPYHQQLKALLSGDPYFDIRPDPKRDSHVWVRLNVGRIKEVRNY